MIREMQQYYPYSPQKGQTESGFYNEQIMEVVWRYFLTTALLTKIARHDQYGRLVWAR